MLVAGYKLLAPSGFDVEVTFLGKLATWVLYAALGFVLVTAEGTDWPIVLLWIGIALSVRGRSAVRASCLARCSGKGERPRRRTCER